MSSSLSGEGQVPDGEAQIQPFTSHVDAACVEERKVEIPVTVEEPVKLPVQACDLGGLRPVPPSGIFSCAPTGVLSDS